MSVPLTIPEALAALQKMVPRIDSSLTDDDRRQAWKTWSILTALRGPDIDMHKDEYDMLKPATTEVIRWAVLGYPDDAPYYFEVGRDNIGKVSLRKSLEINVSQLGSRSVMDIGVIARNDEQRHFLVHAVHAFHALGLKWDELNVKPTEVPSEAA